MNTYHVTSWDGTTLFGRSWLPAGRAKTALLLLHRGHEHSGRLDDVVGLLGLRDVAVFAFDARGHGRSSGTATRASDLVRDVEAVARHIVRTHDVALDEMFVLGVSLGGVLAAAWVHDYAPPVRGLILVSPAFRINLMVPGALSALRVWQRLRPEARVRSRVTPAMLTSDPREAARYRSDPSIDATIRVDLLLSVRALADRIVDDARAITTPTLVLEAAADRVVTHGASAAFFERLGAAFRERHVYPNMRHDVLHEIDRATAIAHVRSFIEHVRAQPVASGADRPDPAPLAPSAPRGVGLGMLKLVLATVGRLSAGVRAGWSTGFDSGISLDYVYRDTPHGATLLGRWLDRLYLDAAGWRAIRRRRAALGARLERAVAELGRAGRPAHVVDIAAGVGRYVLELMYARPDLGITAELRDRDRRSLAAGRALAATLGVTSARFVEADAFDPSVRPAATPTVAVVSGLYELFSDNALVASSLRALYGTMAPGGVLLYTNQPWHPQLDVIARVLVNREGQPWVMRCRSQAEMDGLVAAAGFRKEAMDVDEQGIFTVSVARKAGQA